MTVLYQDEHILVIDKPASAPSEPDGSGRDVLSLAKAETGADCRLVHRLDRGTGGAMVLAKTAGAAAALSEAIRSGAFQKTYLAVTAGVPEKSADTWRDLLYHDAQKNKSYVVRRLRRGVREAVLDYVTVSVRGGCALVRVTLHTGRTHQIRVQFASRHLPLLGDRKYGGGDGCPMALRCAVLSFPHPATGETVTFSSPLPEADPWKRFEE